ncbi:hypothetical protein GCM10028791_27740 [Echinicola sediminis]
MVDNASEDGSLDKLKQEFKHPVFIANDQNLGFTGGNNVGMRYALQEGFEYIMLLNNDTEVAPDFLVHLLNTFEQSPTIGAVQPLMYYMHDKAKVWNAGGKWKKWRGDSLAIKHKMDGELSYFTDWITGCCMLVRAEVIKKVGLLNDHYFAYFEDVDWSLRMKSIGYQLAVVPSSVIYHEAGASSKSTNKGKEGTISPNVHYLATRNQLFQLRNHVHMPYAVSAWLYQLGKFMLYSFYFLVRNRREKLAALLRGVVDGVRLNS